MSKNPPAIGPSIATDRGSGEPLYFPSGDRALFAWLHQGAAPALRDVGIVVCKPFGIEAMWAHRRLRAFAEATAVAGFPTLLFDYAGTGDSEDVDPEADQLELWRNDVIAAVGELRRRTHVRQVCLLGFRFGALTAAMAALRCDAVAALALVAPVVSGKHYARELRAAWLAGSGGIALGNGTAGAAAAATVGQAEAGAMEINGYPISAATVAAVAAVDLKTLRIPRIAAMLIIDRGDLPASRAWTEQLVHEGINVRRIMLPGAVEMMRTEPHLAAAPKALIESTCEWLQQLRPSDSELDESRGEPLTRYRADIRATTLVSTSTAQATEITEHAVKFGADLALFGIATEPPSGERRRRGVILLNSGGTHHIGPNRMYVSLARRWARRGYVVLRMDLAGLGDSGTPTDSGDLDIFPTSALDDIRSSIELLRSRWGVRDITVAGLCSGAYYSLRAAAAGLPVSRILMVSPMNFLRRRRPLPWEVREEVGRHPGLFRKLLLSAAAWRASLRGKSKALKAIKAYCHRSVLALECMLRDVARLLAIRLPDDLGPDLKAIAGRGVRMVFVFAQGDPGFELLRIQGGSTVKRLGGLCRVHTIGGADHVFSRADPRAALENMLSDELFAPQEDRRQRRMAASVGL